MKWRKKKKPESVSLPLETGKPLAELIRKNRVMVKDTSVHSAAAAAGKFFWKNSWHARQECISSQGHPRFYLCLCLPMSLGKTDECLIQYVNVVGLPSSQREKVGQQKGSTWNSARQTCLAIAVLSWCMQALCAAPGFGIRTLSSRGV